jgi:glycosyltransferase involved in cell wall biosynthesis
MPELIIGMPVYNGVTFITQAIESIRNQTFTGWALVISDNASTDGTRDICERFCSQDSRIRYCRQERNIGAPANFKFLLDQAGSPFFMWAASDDLWHPEFVSAAISLLKKDGDCGFAFCNIVNVDAFGQTVRSYGDFRRFAGDDQRKNVIAYAAEPEILGKANIIYSIYRTEVCKSAWERCPLTNRWGSDMCFVLAVLAYSWLAVDERVLFFKRLIRPDDKPAEPHPIVIEKPELITFKMRNAPHYCLGYLKGTWKSRYFFVTVATLLRRMPYAIAKSFYGYAVRLRNRLRE